MKILFSAILVLFLNTAVAEDKISVVTLPKMEAFYREFPQGKFDLGVEVQTFIKSIQLYYLYQAKEIFLVIEGKRTVGVGMELVYPDKRVPKNRIYTREAGKFMQLSHTGKIGVDNSSKFKKFAEEKKLKPRGNVVYIFRPFYPTPKDAITTLVPVE